MPRLETREKSAAKKRMADIYDSLGEKLATSTVTACPVELTSAFMKTAAMESCGKCVPCRVGLSQLMNLIDEVLDGSIDSEEATDTLELIASLSNNIYLTADCAIGFETAAVVNQAVKGFADDFLYHIKHHDCLASPHNPIPCVSACPAGIDIPGYIALAAAGRYDDALMLIRKNNPLVSVCALICNNPCELHCRRNFVDDAVNIRGIKRSIVDRATGAMKLEFPIKVFPIENERTGKKVAVVGGGPAGLSAAFYLTLMGHQVTIFEQHLEFGGMLRYGIPANRLPVEALNTEIDWLFAHGIHAAIGTTVGKDISFDELRAKHDAVYLSIGAQSASKLGIPGEDLPGVLSAIELLHNIGEGTLPDFSGKRVAVVGGGNVAMDVARTALRLGATSVTIVYRRRKQDMPAKGLEIDAAVAEGCEVFELQAPVRVEAQDDMVRGLVVQPQIVAAIEGGRASVRNAETDEVILPCDIVLVAIGQRVDSLAFAEAGITTHRNLITVDENMAVQGIDGVFAGGDCVTGPDLVIRAIAAGKTAAESIDTYLGFAHSIELDLDIPRPAFSSTMHCARSNMREKVFENLSGCFELTEQSLMDSELAQETARCLRCDYYGLGALRKGRSS